MRQIDTDKWGWLKDAVPIFILAGLALIFFSDVIFRDKIFIHRDLSRFFYPLREFSANEFLRFRIPLWNPYIHCGSPHLAELQTCVFYPLSVIYLLFSYPNAFNYFIVVHIFLAGLFIYILMKEWGYSKYACFLSGTAFMFSGYIISVINLPASLASVVWLPPVILFYERALKKDWVKNSIITGIFMALMFLGGEPVILYATFFILLLFNGVVLDSPPAADHSNNISILRAKSRSMLLATIVFLGLASFQILPFMEFIRYTSRGAMDFKEASMWSLPPYAILDLFIPYLSESDYIYKDYWTRQSWLLVYYMGIVTVIFSLIALKFDAGKRRRIIFYILALGLALSFGKYTPLYYILYKILPGFKFSRYPIKFFFMVTFSLALLAGMGMDYYRQNIKAGQGLRRFLKHILIAGFIFSFVYLASNLNFKGFCDIFQAGILNIGGQLCSKRGNIEQLVPIGLGNINRGIGLFMFLSVIMFLGIKKKVSVNSRTKGFGAGVNILAVMIIAVSLIDIFTANKNVYQNMGIKEFLKPGNTVGFLQADKSLFRIFDSPATLWQNMFVPERDYFEGMSGLRERAVSDRGVSFGIYDAYGYGSLYNKRHEEIIGIIVKSKMPDDTKLLNLLNVKYLISPKDLKIDGYRMAKKAEKANIYENENCLPRAFLADKAVIIKDEKKILEKMKSKEFIPEKEVILEEVLDSALRASLEQYFSSERAKHAPYEIENFRMGRLSREGSVDILKYEPSYVEIKAETSAPKFLVLSDTYYPGWKVSVDGKPGKIYRADYILRAVYLESGRHIVKFAYDPFSFKIGFVITLAVMGVLLGLWIFRRR